jgi:transposase InsO family protein
MESWRDAKQGLLEPLSIPDRPWQDISLDSITGLPRSDGYTNLLVITDRLTRGVILEGMAEVTPGPTAWALVRTVIRRHGIPKSIVSDRGPQFTSSTWKRVCQLLNITRLSTAFHPRQMEPPSE